MSVLLLLVACNNEILPHQDLPAEAAAQAAEPQYEKGYVRIFVSENLSETLEAATHKGLRLTQALAADDVVAEVKIRSIQRTFPVAGRFEARSRKAGLHLWYDVEFDAQISIADAHQGLSRVQGIRKVEYRPMAARYWDDNVIEYVHEMALSAAQPAAAMPFNDPRLPDQWHYYNDGSLGTNYRAGADVNVLGAWSYTAGSPDVVVAVIDGGIDYTHEDIAANMWVNLAEKNGSSSLDDDGNGYKNDIYGYNFVSDVGQLVPHHHGTHVAGTIAAVNNNGKGVCGIAGGNGQSNSGIRLMSCQIFVNDDDPYANSAGRSGAAAIKYAADNGAVICQNSWGYPSLTETPGSDKAAIDYFIEHAGIDENGHQTGAMRGGIVIFAAGNENRAAAAPANYSKVVAVSSIAPDFRKAYYSNYGEWIDLAAPGGDVQSFGNKGTVLSTVVGGYGYMQGTSMACPHVSGVAALTLSYFKKTGYNADMLRARLESSAANINSYNSGYIGKLGKLVNAQAALAGGSTMPPGSVGTVTGSIQSNTATLRWTVPADPDDGKASGFNVYYSKSSLSSLNANNPPANVMINSYPTGDLSVGAEFEAEVKDLDFESIYYFRVNAFDFSGNFSSLSAQITQSTHWNNPPVIQVVDSADVVMKAHQTVVLHFVGSDPDGHAIEWSIDPPVNGVAIVDMGDGNAQLTITGTKSAQGEHSINLVLKDKYGASVSQIIHFEVLQNHAPEIVNTIDNLYFGALSQEKSFEISNYFKDVDNEPLKYSFQNTSPTVVNVNENKGKLYFVSLAYGLAQITITATDAMGLSVSQQFSVLTRDDRQAVDIYPNPVKDFVWLRTGQEQHCVVTIVSNAGAKIVEKEMDISPFAPAQIDLSAYSGGVYNVSVKFAENEIKKQIIKL
ncbi:hypothetical protein FACS1894156_3110 [Bacteroidia bacterium]|nr:hypothetical protein FACS1894156_3110 [Bacteroidia bacterium]